MLTRRRLGHPILLQIDRMQPHEGHRLAGPAGEEAGNLVGSVALERFAGDVVAAQRGLWADVAQQALDVAQWDALVESDGADRAAQLMWADGPGDAGRPGGGRDIAVHGAAFQMRVA